MATEVQKITANIPKTLLASAKQITGAGISETLKIGLEKIIKNKANTDLLNCYGRYQFPISLEALRNDDE